MRSRPRYATFASPISAFNPNAISTPQLGGGGGYAAAASAPGVADLSMGAAAACEVHLSARHNGLYLYLGRILRQVWLLPLARQLSVGGVPLLDSVVTSEELMAVLQQLHGLRLFVQRHIHPNLQVRSTSNISPSNPYGPFLDVG